MFIFVGTEYIMTGNNVFRLKYSVKSKKNKIDLTSNNDTFSRRCCDGFMRDENTRNCIGIST